MQITVFCRCDEFVCCVECCSFEVFVTVCRALTGECLAGNATGVSGLFRGLCVTSNDGWHLLEKCLTNVLRNGLRDEGFWDACCPSGLPTGKEEQAICCRAECRQGQVEGVWACA